MFLRGKSMYLTGNLEPHLGMNKIDHKPLALDGWMDLALQTLIAIVMQMILYHCLQYFAVCGLPT